MFGLNLTALLLRLSVFSFGSFGCWVWVFGCGGGGCGCLAGAAELRPLVMGPWLFCLLSSACGCGPFVWPLLLELGLNKMRRVASAFGFGFWPLASGSLTFWPLVSGGGAMTQPQVASHAFCQRPWPLRCRHTQTGVCVGWEWPLRVVNFLPARF